MAVRRSGSKCSSFAGPRRVRYRHTFQEYLLRRRLIQAWMAWPSDLSFHLIGSKGAGRTIRIKPRKQLGALGSQRTKPSQCRNDSVLLNTVNLSGNLAPRHSILLLLTPAMSFTLKFFRVF